MPTQEKKQAVEEFEKQVRECKGLILTAYKGLKTTELNEFPQKLRPLKGEYRVVKNSLTRIALKNAGMEALANALEGPTAVVLERGDPLAGVKALFEFAKTHEHVKVSAGVLEGQILS